MWKLVRRKISVTQRAERKATGSVKSVPIRGRPAEEWVYLVRARVNVANPGSAGLTEAAPFPSDVDDRGFTALPTVSTSVN